MILPEGSPMPEMISEDDARYALDLVQAICTQVGPGMPGTPQERERAAMIQKELEAHQFEAAIVKIIRLCKDQESKSGQSGREIEE